MIDGDQNRHHLVNRYDVPMLIERSARLLGAAGARADIARVVAEVLVEGEMMGHDTHGLNLLAPYADELLSGKMSGDGEWHVERSSVASELWDGRRLPGPWLVRNAIAAATAKARGCGTATISVGRSHHIACLAAYLVGPATNGLLVTIQSSDPAAAGVAPFGGTSAVISPNPFAAGIPARPRPIIVDVSTSITTFGLARRTAAAGKRLPGKWLLDAQGNPTDDPNVLATTPPGTLLPLGGIESGHKGFGLGLFVDVLTGSLSGAGRSSRPTEWGASFLVTVIDPDAFCGLERFLDDTSDLAAMSRKSSPRDPHKPVRMPGERGLARRADALRHGLALSPETASSLDAVAKQVGLAERTP